jgi:hypothetical protein
MICIVNLLSKQPLYNERMNFPLLRVPFMMEEALDQTGLGRFFANRFLIAGLMVPVFLHTLNGLAFYNPSIPQIPTLILAGPYFPKVGLLSGFLKLKIFIYPAFIGFAFLTSVWPAQRFGIQYPCRCNGCDVWSDHFTPGRDPDDWRLHCFFCISSLAGPISFH